MLLQELSRSRLFEPFREMERLQGQLNRLLDGYSTWHATSEFPPVNVWVSQDNAILSCELPGMSSSDIELSVVNDTLTIRGSRQSEELKESNTLHRRERPGGAFSRSLQLPFRVDADKMSASFKHGILTITMPRAEQDKPRKIAVCSQ